MLPRSVYGLVILTEREMGGGNEKKKVGMLGGKEKGKEDIGFHMYRETSGRKHNKLLRVDITEE